MVLGFDLHVGIAAAHVFAKEEFNGVHLTNLYAGDAAPAVLRIFDVCPIVLYLDQAARTNLCTGAAADAVVIKSYAHKLLPILRSRTDNTVSREAPLGVQRYCRARAY